MAESVKIVIDGQEFEFPVIEGSENEKAIDISSLRAKTGYITQFVHSDLMICNMVFDGVPVILPVPFVGGRLNANLF